MKVRVLYNRDPKAMMPFRGYVAGDSLEEVLILVEEEKDVVNRGEMLAICEKMFHSLNVDHPLGWMDRSMSVGDVVVIGEVAYSCESFGFKEADISDSRIKRSLIEII